jgi:hypothetical protein
MKTKMIEILWKMTEKLASLIAGATNRTIEGKGMEVEMHLLGPLFTGLLGMRFSPLRLWS